MSDTRLTRPHHTVHGTDGTCLGIKVWLWCPGCDQLHAPTFRCPEHGGPTDGPVWDGDPALVPFTMSPSLLVQYGPDRVCHSFIRDGAWDFLADSTAHDLRGHVPLVPLPEWAP